MKILGISCEQDAGAVVNIDGKVIAACNEERFNRKKLYIGFPEKSIKAVCEITSLEPNDFDYIAISTANHIPSLDYTELAPHQRIGEKLSLLKPIQLALQTNTFTNFVKGTHFTIQTHFRIKVINELRRLGFNQKIYFLDHHACHAASAYFTGGMKDALVITLDGAGDGYCSKVYTQKENKLYELHKIPFYGSPGYYYSYATSICGFKYGREGKLTGLAAYGNPATTKSIFKSRIRYDSEKMKFINSGHYFNSETKYLKNLLGDASKEDIAAGIQTYLEEMVTSYISDLIKNFRDNKPTKLALAGGVFANVKLNQKISELENVDEIFIHPHMGDGGLALGASFVMLMKKNFFVIPYLFENAYLGTSYREGDILQAISISKESFYKTENPGVTMAKAISEGKVVAYFSGSMEYGPRALGHRSVFVSAKDPSINQSLNQRLERSEFMPFAPIILKERENDYFANLRSKQKCLPFMTITTGVKDKALKDIPAAVHIDNTARFQSITKEQNPVVYEMLKAHEAITGVPCVINTSFNMHEEPIVECPNDAVDAFKRGNLDMLVMDNFVLENKNCEDTINRVSAEELNVIK